MSLEGKGLSPDVYWRKVCFVCCVCCVRCVVLCCVVLCWVVFVVNIGNPDVLEESVCFCVFVVNVSNPDIYGENKRKKEAFEERTNRPWSHARTQKEDKSIYIYVYSL